jgi:hypothetical protein
MAAMVFVAAGVYSVVCFQLSGDITHFIPDDEDSPIRIWPAR